MKVMLICTSGGDPSAVLDELAGRAVAQLLRCLQDVLQPEKNYV